MAYLCFSTSDSDVLHVPLPTTGPGTQIMVLWPSFSFDVISLLTCMVAYLLSCLILWCTRWNIKHLSFFFFSNLHAFTFCGFIVGNVTMYYIFLKCLSRALPCLAWNAHAHAQDSNSFDNFDHVPGFKKLDMIRILSYSYVCTRWTWYYSDCRLALKQHLSALGGPRFV